jgi:hypothetical protein
MINLEKYYVKRKFYKLFAYARSGICSTINIALKEIPSIP